MVLLLQYSVCFSFVKCGYRVLQLTDLAIHLSNAFAVALDIDSDYLRYWTPKSMQVSVHYQSRSLFFKSSSSGSQYILSFHRPHGYLHPIWIL